MEVERFEWKEERRRKLPNIKRYILPTVMILIILGILILIILYPPDFSFFNYRSSPIESIQSEISISPARSVAGDKYIMTIGEESTIKFSFYSDKSGEVKSAMELTPGVQYILGNIQMNDTVAVNQTNSLIAYVRAVRVGKWNIKGIVISGNRTFEQSFELCIDVLEDKARDRCK